MRFTQNKIIIAIITAIVVLCIILAVFTITPGIEKEMKKRTDIIDQLTEKAVNSIESRGILQFNTTTYPKFKNIEVEVYYNQDYCLSRVRNAIKRFDNVEIKKVKRLNKEELIKDKVNTLGSDSELPRVIIIFGESNKEERRIISGLAGCSEEILAYNVCDSMLNPPELCSKYMHKKTEIKDPEIRPVEDKECYDDCLIEYGEGNNIINQLWNGPPCDRIMGFKQGISEIISKKCLDKSCKDNNQDKACCNGDNCVYKNDCYSIGDMYDVDDNNQTELCVQYDNDSFWVDPDKDSLSCSLANSSWLSCKPKSKCINSVSGYDLMENGICCSDDENEFYTKCKGELCIKEDDEDSACCNANQCVYDNKCYQAGCVDINTDLGVKRAYCDGFTNEWTDLDEEYCELCLGKGSWSGYFCCGDDEHEGASYKELIIHAENANISANEFICVDKESQCTSYLDGKRASKGCFNITNYGRYYCEKGVWYDPDNNQKYCEECNFNWMSNKSKNKCCGDDEQEYYIEGDDKTYACCNSNSSYAQNRTCYNQYICGNNKVEGKEECEPINATNNIYCNQTAEICVDGRLGKRDNLGNCGPACECSYDDFSFSCSEGKCSAECDDDNDCGNGMSCNTNECRCYEKKKSSDISE
ncbi:MAG: hypothetical protein ABII01_00670, partial [Candidatus Woesearchaeota archaeon]